MFEVDGNGNLIDPKVGILTFINLINDSVYNECYTLLDATELELYKKIIEYQKYLKDKNFKIIGKFNKISIENIRLYTEFVIPVFDKKTYNLLLKKSRDINKFLKCNLQSININKEKKERTVRMFFDIQELNPKGINKFIKFLRKTSRLIFTKQ